MGSELTLFQRILAGEIPGSFIARGHNWGAFLDVFPRSPGHTLVVPSTPAQRIAELPAEELADLLVGVQETQAKLSDFFDTDDFTVVVHDGPAAGQEIPHVHFHVIPRLAGDGGRALPAMFPNANIPATPDYSGLAELATKIRGD